MERNRMFRVAIGLVVTGMLVVGGATAQTKVVINEAHTSTLTMAPVYIAEAAGYMAAEGIDLQFTEVDSGALGTQALIAGGVQIVDGDPVTVVNLAKQGKKVQFFYNLTRRVTLDLIVSNEVVKAKGLKRDMPIAQRLAALKGLRLGISSPGGAPDLYMRYYIKLAGLDSEKDVQIMSVGGGGPLTAALKSKQIDAFHLSAPTPYQAQALGLGTVIIKGSAGDVPQLDNFFYTGLMTTKDWADKNSALIVKYVRAVNKAQALLSTDMPKALEYLKKYFPTMDPAVMSMAMNEIHNALSSDGKISEAMMQKNLQFLYDTQQVDTLPSAKEGVYWTNAYTK